MHRAVYDSDQIGTIQLHLTGLEKELVVWHRSNELSQRLATIPGIGVISVTALAVLLSNLNAFAPAASSPLHNYSGGRERKGQISRMGDRYLRRLLVVSVRHSSDGRR